MVRRTQYTHTHPEAAITSNCFLCAAICQLKPSEWAVPVWENEEGTRSQVLLIKWSGWTDHAGADLSAACWRSAVVTLTPTCSKKQLLPPPSNFPVIWSPLLCAECWNVAEKGVSFLPIGKQWCKNRLTRQKRESETAGQTIVISAFRSCSCLWHLYCRTQYNSSH